jgi:uncharacterized protein
MGVAKFKPLKRATDRYLPGVETASIYDGFRLRHYPVVLRWAVLLAGSLALIVPLELAHLPAAVLLGAMAAAVAVSQCDGALAVPRWPFVLAQGLIGCLMAGSIGPVTLQVILRQWPIFLGCVLAVLVFSVLLSAAMARWKVLQGSTAVWGTMPGAATAMILMSQGFGGDPRLVAFMQFLRVMLVACAAAVVARLSGLHGAAPHYEWFPAVPAGFLGATIAVAVVGAVAGELLRIPGGSLLLPLFAGGALSIGGEVQMITPPWLMAGSYALVGWAIGLRFTREIVRYAAHALPRIVAAILILMGLCGVLAWALHLVAGTDPLTAYLATSPGGADSVAIIAASSPVDLPFVMAMQTARFLLVIVLGPWLARAVTRWTGADVSTRAAGQI